jgi:CheY-like chemotaxis protein
MEAVGRLAGGVAHDFNNLLTVILGSSDFMLARGKLDGPDQESAAMIRDAGRRGAALTRQLLTFSRRQVLAPEVLSLNARVTNLESMLRRLIGEDITLVTDLDPGLCPVETDPGQIEQVIMNLAVNSRDAMPQGGRLTIRTRTVELNEAYAEDRPSVRPGTYAVLAVEDSGVGMDEETKRHLFEPFFTTKEVGKGTGLGLAAVYGIVKQSGGHIEVESEPGRGTTFKIYLPRAREVAPAVRPSQLLPPRPSPTHGSETVLLVEDEDGVRALARTILQVNQYNVLEARDGAEALKVTSDWSRPIDLMLTDVVMPQLSGYQLADRLKPARPGMKVLFMSGYTDDAISHHQVLSPDAHFLQKPFTPDVLARKVREVLDE